MRRFTLLLPFVATATLAGQVVTIPPVPRVEPWRPVPAMNMDMNMDMNTVMNTVMDMRYNFAEAFSTVNSNLLSISNGVPFGTFGIGGGPSAWASSDPADTLFRNARDMLNKGDYRRAADLFKSLPQKFPSSAYVADAQYWQAYSLYRIGGTPDLQEALAVLEARKPTHQDSMRTGLLSRSGVGRGIGNVGARARRARLAPRRTPSPWRIRFTIRTRRPTPTVRHLPRASRTCCRRAG